MENHNVTDWEVQRIAQLNDSLGDIRRILAGDTVGTDAVEGSAFIISQLAYTESQTFAQKYQPMQYEQFIPIDTSAGAYATTIRYEIMDYAGRAKRIHHMADDIPLVDVAYSSKEYPVINGAIGYQYSTEELRRSAFLRRPVTAAKPMAAMRAYREELNEVGLYGSAINGLTGLFNNPLVPTGNAPTGNWLTATPEQMLADVNTLITNVWTNSQFTELVTDIILPPINYNQAVSRRSATGAATDMTVLDWIKMKNVSTAETGRPIRISPGYNLATAGAGGTRRMVGYVKDPQNVVMHVPLPLQFLAPQPKGLKVLVPGEYKYAGTEFRYPGSAYYMDGL